MAKANRSTKPLLPRSVWMLWLPNENEFMPAMDQHLLGCCPTQAEAYKAAKHQMDIYGIECTPVKVK